MLVRFLPMQQKARTTSALRVRSSPALRNEPAFLKGPMRPRKVILCVDDNEQTLAVRKFLLETRGYRVICAGNAQHALECLEKTEPGGVDLLLCDLLMPQMDGNELVRRARMLRPGIPTLMISGTVTAMERGFAADAFLPKGNSSAAELLERVRILVARKRGPKKAVTSAPALAPSVGVTAASAEQRLAS